MSLKETNTAMGYDLLNSSSLKSEGSCRVTTKKEREKGEKNRIKAAPRAAVGGGLNRNLQQPFKTHPVLRAGPGQDH